jgi:hypothetical protein
MGVRNCDCPKRSYPGRKSAASAAARVRADANEIVDYYRCQNNNWHVGHPIAHDTWETIKDRMNRSDARFYASLVEA